LVGEARSIGLLGAVEIVARKGSNQRFGGAEGKAGPLVRDICIRRGLMVRAVRDSIVMSPPLVITREQIDILFLILTAALNEAAPLLAQ